MSWKNQLPNTFGSADGIFGLHPYDEERAEGMLRTAEEEGASKDDVIAAVREHGNRQGWTTEHIDEQLNRARDMMKKLGTPSR